MVIYIKGVVYGLEGEGVVIWNSNEIYIREEPRAGQEVDGYLK